MIGTAVLLFMPSISVNSWSSTPETYPHLPLPPPCPLTCTAATLHRNRVQLVKEEDARSGAARLVEDLTHIGLRLAEPHGQQLGALRRYGGGVGGSGKAHGDEVGLALVGNGLGQQRLTTARGSVEQYTLGGGHAKLLKLLGVLNGVLDELLQVWGR